MLRRGYGVAECAELSMIDPFFVHKILNIIQWEESLRGRALSDIGADEMRFLKQRGFSDKTIARLTGTLPDAVYNARKAMGILPVYKMVDTCGGEFDAVSNYFYSTYDTADESVVSDREKVVVIGSGPIRIGQGLSSTTAPSTGCWPCGKWATRPSSSTTTRKPSVRISTSLTSCTSSPSPKRMC